MIENFLLEHANIIGLVFALLAFLFGVIIMWND